jgi:hypothetical protein
MSSKRFIFSPEPELFVRLRSVDKLLPPLASAAQQGVSAATAWRVHLLFDFFSTEIILPPPAWEVFSHLL